MVIDRLEILKISLIDIEDTFSRIQHVQSKLRINLTPLTQPLFS